MTDWFSTILDVAGLRRNIPNNVDSISMKRVLMKNKPSKRREIVLNLDKDDKRKLWSAAILWNNKKLIWGQSDLLKQKVNTKLLVLSCSKESEKYPKQILDEGCRIHS